MPIQLSSTAKELFKPKRNKVLYGGRGGGKSHDVAGALIVMGAKEKLLILCTREVQKSIKQSVHRLLKNKIEQYGLTDFYEVQNDKIIGANGTEFHFTGLKYDPDGIKSYEGTDICWVEEANNVSERSWEVLIPTIRKEGSEIWVTFNPRYESDPTWRRFVVGADEHTFVKKVSWRDNPWFPNTLNLERMKLQKQDSVAYNHIWEGEFDERFQGAVYASQIKTAREQGRISNVPYKPGVPVIAAWDLGRSDSTSIWFAQKVGKEIRIIDFYENNNEDLPHYAEVIRNKPFPVATNYLPHDSKHERLGMVASIKDQLKGMGLNCEDVTSAIGEQAGIALGRTFIAECWFDENNTKDGLHALSNFTYEWDDNNLKFKDKPKHDWSSHASDAFRYLAIVMNTAKEETSVDLKLNTHHHTGGDGWLY